MVDTVDIYAKKVNFHWHLYIGKENRNMKKLALMFLLWMSCLYGATAGDEITGKVVSVIDGNTLEVVSGLNETHKIMLAGSASARTRI